MSIFVELFNDSCVSADEGEISMDEAGFMFFFCEHVDCGFESSACGVAGVIDPIVHVFIGVVGMKIFVAEVAVHFSAFILGHGGLIF